MSPYCDVRKRSAVVAPLDKIHSWEEYHNGFCPGEGFCKWKLQDCAVPCTRDAHTHPLGYSDIFPSLNFYPDSEDGSSFFANSITEARRQEIAADVEAKFPVDASRSSYEFPPHEWNPQHYSSDTQWDFYTLYE